MKDVIQLSAADVNDKYSRYELSTYRKGISNEFEAMAVVKSRGKGESIIFIEEKKCYAIVREL